MTFHCKPTSDTGLKSPSCPNILVGCHDNNIYCISGEGKLVWKKEMNSTVYATPFPFCSDQYCEKKRISNKVISQTNCAINHMTRKHDASFDHGNEDVLKTPEEYTYSQSTNRKTTLNKGIKFNSLEQSIPMNSYSGQCIHPSLCNSMVVCASTKGRIEILSSHTGKLCGQITLPGEVFSSPVLYGNKLVIGCRNNFLYCYDLVFENV